MTTHNSPEQNLDALGFTLPPAPAPGGNYVAAKQVGSVLYLSGVISSDAGGIITAARACALTQLAVLKRELGSLDCVAEVLTVNGYVNAAPGFEDSPEIINGASDLLVQVFGEAGRHVRAAVGLSALPRNALVEVQMTVRVKES